MSNQTKIDKSEKLTLCQKEKLKELQNKKQAQKKQGKIVEK